MSVFDELVILENYFFEEY